MITTSVRGPAVEAVAPAVTGHTPRRSSAGAADRSGISTVTAHRLRDH